MNPNKLSLAFFCCVLCNGGLIISESIVTCGMDKAHWLVTIIMGYIEVVYRLQHIRPA